MSPAAKRLANAAAAWRSVPVSVRNTMTPPHASRPQKPSMTASPSGHPIAPIAPAGEHRTDMATSLSYYELVVEYLLRWRSVKRRQSHGGRGRACYRPMQILAISGAKLANDATAEAPSTPTPPTLATK